MAPVLQCPRCRSKHPLDRHAGEASFACTGCGQLLKVPEQFRSAPPRRSAPQPPPADATGVQPRSSTSVVPAAASPPAARRRPRMVWRVAAWVAAVLLGGAIVLVGGRVVGYLDGQRALDVVISSGVRRYMVLLPLVPIWAVVTTILVTLFLDGGQAIARRRRRGGGPAPEPEPAVPPPAPARPPEARAEPAPVPAAPPPADPPPPRRPTEGRRAGGHGR